MNMKLEVVALPVSDVDRSADFCKALGRRLDADFATGPDFRVVTAHGKQHGKQEEEIGQPDPDWPTWYAQYMANEKAGEDAEA